MTFATIKTRVRSNLEDAGVTFYSEDDLTDSLQDAYDDVAFQAKCIVKSTSLDFLLSPYIDFSLYISDFLQVTAIFNLNTNRWLQDNLSIRDFDKLRSDWELWSGTPQWWSPADIKMNVILPYYASAPLYQMTVYYNAQAPTITDDSESPLIALNFQKLLEWYCTGDMLEQAEEYTKAGGFFAQYTPALDEYKEAVQLQAKRDLLVII